MTSIDLQLKGSVLVSWLDSFTEDFEPDRLSLDDVAPFTNTREGILFCGLCGFFEGFFISDARADL